MRVKRLGLAERHRRRSQNAERTRVAFEQRGALHEVEHAEPEEKRAERAVGRTWFEPPT